MRKEIAFRKAYNSRSLLNAMGGALPAYQCIYRNSILPPSFSPIVQGNKLRKENCIFRAKHLMYRIFFRPMPYLSRNYQA